MTQLPYSTARAIAGAALLGTIAFASPLCAASLNFTQAPAVDPALAMSAQATSTPTYLLIPAKASSVDRAETRITELHAKLKITAAQEVLWTNVTQVMRDNAAKLDALTKARAENAKSMSAMEDLKSYGEITEAHAEGVKNFIPVFAALYDSMSDAQKKNADAMFRTHVHTASRNN
jgi:hypothetical protein